MRHFLDDMGLVMASYSDDLELPARATDGLAEVWLPDGIPLVPVYEDFAGLPDPTPPIDDSADPLDPADLIPGTPEPQVVGYRIPDLDAATARIVAATTIDRLYDWALKTIAGRATPIEMATWTPKRQLVEDLNGEDPVRAASAQSALAAMVPDNEATANGLASEADKALFMASKIAPKAQAYAAAMAASESALREARVSLAAIPDDPDALMAFADAVRAAAPVRLASFMEGMTGG